MSFVASDAGHDDFTGGLLDSEVDENVNWLSGGQRHVSVSPWPVRWATDAPFLVLHDPTTSVDSVTEAMVAGRLPSIRRGRSTVVISASSALLMVCDQVIDLRAGEWMGAS